MISAHQAHNDAEFMIDGHEAKEVRSTLVSLFDRKCSNTWRGWERWEDQGVALRRYRKRVLFCTTGCEGAFEADGTRLVSLSENMTDHITRSHWLLTLPSCFYSAQVSLVACIRNIVKTSTSTSYLVEDGTGPYIPICYRVIIPCLMRLLQVKLTVVVGAMLTQEATRMSLLTTESRECCQFLDRSKCADSHEKF